MFSPKEINLITINLIKSIPKKYRQQYHQLILMLIFIGIIYNCVPDKNKQSLLRLSFTLILGLYYFLNLYLLLKSIIVAELKEKGFFRERDYKIKKLENLAKIKEHNIKSNYNSFNYFNIFNKSELAKEYANKSAYFYSLSMESWDTGEWSIKKELDLLSAYYNTEKILGKKVTLRFNCSEKNIDLNKVKFIPEVFTVLLNNSILHAFKNTETVYEFKIVMQLKNNLLYFEVSDNGDPGKSRNYFDKKKPNKALKLLDQYLYNEMRIANIDKETFHYQSLTIYPVEGQGTFIQFMFPYATLSS